MNFKTSLAMVLTLATAVPTLAANKVILTKEINCGGYMSLEKDSQSILDMKLYIPAGSSCAKPLNVIIPSQDVRGTATLEVTVIPMQPRILGAALPMQIGDQTIMLDLSNEAVQREIQASYSREELKRIEEDNQAFRESRARDQAERDRRQRVKNTAAAGAGAAVVVGAAGAIAVGAAAQGER